MQSSTGLQSVQEATWSFPAGGGLPPSTATDVPNTMPTSPLAATTSPTTETDADTADASTLPPLVTTDPEEGIVDNDQNISIVAPRTPRKKPRKRKLTDDDDGDFRPSSHKKKRAAPTPAKPKRKTADYYDEIDYKPSKKVVPEKTLEEEIDFDPDICHDDCEEDAGSHQDMIHCDAEACRVGGKWFHTICVGFEGYLPSNIDEFEWYCPTCRVELDVGVETNGLIYRADGGSGTHTGEKASRSGFIVMSRDHLC